MTGVEIDMIVSDSIKAMEQYEKIFDLQPIEVTAFETGNNEAVFSLYGMRFHLLDENPALGMTAPKPEDPKPVWFNIMVPDIQETFEKAVKAGCAVIQPVTEMKDFGVSNAMFSDAYGYIWMLHQIHREVSFQERVRLLGKEEDK